MNIYKIKNYITPEEGEEASYVDLYLDVSIIKGFLIPIDEEGLINIFTNGDMFTIKQEDHLIDYLKKTFVDNANDGTK